MGVVLQILALKAEAIGNKLPERGILHKSVRKYHIEARLRDPRSR